MCATADSALGLQTSHMDMYRCFLSVSVNDHVTGQSHACPCADTKVVLNAD